MWLKRLPILSGVLILVLLGTAACANQTLGNLEGTAITLPQEVTDTPSGKVIPTGQVVATGQVVEVTPLSETEIAARSIGQSAPGASTEDNLTQTAPEKVPPAPGTITMYNDQTYKFGVGYPGNYKFAAMPADKLAQFTPQPAAVFTIMSPVKASSAVEEPADLEVKVFSAAGISTLENWLTQNQLLPGGDTSMLKAFKTDNVSGFQVCASTLIAPGCSYFVTGKGWIYQLTPSSQEGDTIVKTFTLLP